MTRRLLLALAVIATLLTGCVADPPAAVPVPERTTQSKVHCNLIFPAPATPVPLPD